MEKFILQIKIKLIHYYLVGFYYNKIVSRYTFIKLLINHPNFEFIITYNWKQSIIIFDKDHCIFTIEQVIYENGIRKPNIIAVRSIHDIAPNLLIEAINIKK